jgi:cell division protein FtsL
MAAAMVQGATVARRRRSCWAGTPEVYFTKYIDNSRVVRVEDPRRAREMRQFGTALATLFLLVMTYAWQHFRAVEYGYDIADLQRERAVMLENNRKLKLEEATLRDPQRIDQIAHDMGLQAPQPGQVLRLDSALPDGSTPVMARVTPVSVISVR